ncbi:hypothetical protein Tco_0349162 [Tanacetum coccineum]
MTRIAEESSSKRAGEELEQDPTKKQKVDDDKEREDFQQCFELVTEEDVAIDVIPLATKPASIFDREDLEIYGSWLKQSMGIQGQKKAIKECYRLLKIMTKQLKNPESGRIVGIKSFIRLFGITTAHIKVSVAQEERSVETEFSAIVFDDAFTSEVPLTCEPTVSSLNNNKIDFGISFDESTMKITSYFDDLDYLKDFEKEFPAIVYNDALTSKLDFLTEPTVNPQHIDEFRLKDESSLFECDGKEQNVLYFNDLFPFNVIYPDDLKSDKDNDNDKIDIKQPSGDLSIEPLPNVINTNFGAFAHESNKLFETSHDTSDKFFKTKNFIKELNVNIMAWNYLNNGMLLNLMKNLYESFGICSTPSCFITMELNWASQT